MKYVCYKNVVLRCRIARTTGKNRKRFIDPPSHTEICWHLVVILLLVLIVIVYANFIVRLLTYYSQSDL